ncbi:DUF2911 domain-containing protein [Lacibacter sp. MH-610]|uniref:DUF2911 domain-containing protein n=1 Tax=Lacibacter sp. MH-610 TaxID=3020883 RepID=UPI003892CA96
MKKVLFFTAATLLLSIAYSQERFTNPNAIVDTFKKSIPCITKATINGAEIEINYYSPAVKNRTIWGGLVPYGEVWVTGAHSATNISISKPFSIGDVKVKAGKYAIFTIPGKDEWIFILNKNYEQHLADDYKQEEDILRLAVKPITNDVVTERLYYSIVENKLVIGWEKVKIEIPIHIK